MIQYRPAQPAAAPTRKTAMKTGAAGICLTALCVASPNFAHADAETDAIRAQIQALREEQARIVEMQHRTDAALHALEAKLDTTSSASAGAPDTATAAATSPALAAQASADAPSRFQAFGDLRLRGQGDYSDRDGKNRTSAQLRGRLGATYSVNDIVTVGARLATGDPDDPNSTDVQLSNFDDDLQVSLDQAYVQLDLGDLKLHGGKIPQPFARTDLVWDGDVNPQGISATYKHPLESGAALRANALVFIVDENAVARDSTMLGAQLGYDTAALGTWKLDVSAAYYDYQLGSIVGGDAGDFRTNLRNPDGSYLSDFNLGDVIVGATWSGLGSRWPVRMVADYVHNFGAEASADTGYGMDFILGRASQPGDWRFTYGYSMAESDAVLAAFSHDNIAIGTNYRLHTLTLDYTPLPRTLISAVWYHYRPEEAFNAGSNEPGDWLDRIRLMYLVSF